MLLCEEVATCFPASAQQKSNVCMLGPGSFQTQMQTASPTAEQMLDANHVLKCQHTEIWVQGSYHNRQVACCPAQLLGT